MKLLPFHATAIALLLTTAAWNLSAAQPTLAPEADKTTPTRQGPHGGALRQASGLQIETLLSHGGIHLHAFDNSGKPLDIARARGAVTLRVESAAKRYRYDLLPDGQNRLAATVDLSKIAGRQVQLDYQLVNLPGAPPQPIRLREVATVPADPQQLTAAAIARQKVCPVSGKPLGSMGAPVPVTVNGQVIYVCCQGCVDAVLANPEKFATGRPTVVVTTATAEDKQLVAQQAKCPVMDEPLGSMGAPIKVLIGDKPIFLCCKGCIKKVKAEPGKYLAMVYGEQATAAASSSDSGEQVRPGVYRVTAADAPFVAAQQKCPVMDEPLDAMGGPYRVNAAGKAIYICCPGCAKKIAANPQQYLEILAEQGVAPPAVR